MTLIAKITIPGRVAILKNSKRIFGRGRKKIVIPSPKYVAWEDEALAAVLGSYKGQAIDFPCEVHAKFYFANHQGEADLSNMIQGPEDVLQKAGILKNDKLVMRAEMEKFFGHEPRVEIEIYKYNK